MKKIIAILILVVTATTLHAQSWVWAQRLGANKSDKVISIKTDTLGGVYISGYFSNQITLGTNNLVLNNVANPYSKEAYVAKYDTNGVCLWAKAGGAYFDDRVLGLHVAPNGNNVAIGTYWEGSGIKWNNIPITAAGQGSGDQCFIVKHDAFGNHLWGQWICGSSGDDQGTDVCQDLNENVYAVGFMSKDILKVGGTAVTATNANGTDYKKHSYWLAKLDKNGTPKFGRCFGNLPWDTSYGKYIERDIAVCTDNKGGVYITGGFDHTWPFGTTTLTSKGGYDIFVMKYDTNGNFIWAKSGGSTKDDWANGISVDDKDNLYICGEHRDSLFYDTLIVRNYNGRDAFVIKLDAKTGAGIWGSRAGNADGGERANDVLADTACNVWVVGDINENAKFGDNITTPTNGKKLEAFVARIGAEEGKWKWVQTGGGTDSNDRCNSISKGLGNQLYISGFFRAPSTYGSFGPFVSSGASDGFLARLYDSSMKKACAPPPPTPDTLDGAIVGGGNPTKDSIADPLYIPPPPLPTDSSSALVPSAFTPNGDGHNDIFIPKFVLVNIGDIKNYYFAVANRYGQLVYETNTPTQGWNGKYTNGDAAELGVYSYVIKYTVSPFSKKRLFKGDVTLLR